MQKLLALLLLSAFGGAAHAQAVQQKTTATRSTATATQSSKTTARTHSVATPSGNTHTTTRTQTVNKAVPPVKKQTTVRRTTNTVRHSGSR
ncbi:hypothetical protein K3G63_05420 [Hymenobacter sp. HSC-4F20]|uniref:hypothetical protein n=1 Tax=Hymenobacter sp. HSC-4F20 TaxID=2864135 RepID=UPI001C73068F|nr:hypothetical protein [Hymenobacter sp. HSC-4F20]MBX0289867.1 hypothetical protein [Hymenobacter sp. HSC-4F20]